MRKRSRNRRGVHCSSSRSRCSRLRPSRRLPPRKPAARPRTPMWKRPSRSRRVLPHLQRQGSDRMAHQPNQPSRNHTRFPCGRWHPHGASEPHGKGDIVVSDKKYKNVEVYMEVKPDWGCDGGLFLRSTEAGEAYQVTLDYLPRRPSGHHRQHGRRLWRGAARASTPRSRRGTVDEGLEARRMEPRTRAHRRRHPAHYQRGSTTSRSMISPIPPTAPSAARRTAFWRLRCTAASAGDRRLIGDGVPSR